jgi:short-subunit dehydrogenase
VAELYACAGCGRRGPFGEDEVGPQLEIARVNLLSRIHLARAALADMSAHGFGRVVLIASSSAFQPLPFMATYAATNAALLSFGEALGFELRTRGVDVLTVCPGGMRTAFQHSAGVREVEGERLMAPQEAARRIVGALAGGTGTLLLSARCRAMALLARCLPRSISVLLWGKLMAGLR